MKKWVVFCLAAFLMGCAANAQKKAVIPALTPPEATEPGYLRISPKDYYYVDISSVWAETDKRHIIHFDSVINLKKGVNVFDNPNLYAKSIRQAKIVDCQTYHLSQINTDYYSEFWGKGEHQTAKSQRQYVLKLRPSSSLYTLAEVICVNLLR